MYQYAYELIKFKKYKKITHILWTDPTLFFIKFQVQILRNEGVVEKTKILSDKLTNLSEISLFCYN
jgi:hypothetical protein